MSEVAAKEKFFVDPFYAGHGVGKYIHMKPLVSHTLDHSNVVMEEGMVFTIEPILTMFPFGVEDLCIWRDNWTVSVKDNPSAQYEHMVLIKQNGCEVLTR